jgi:hypothetical protein
VLYFRDPFKVENLQLQESNDAGIQAQRYKHGEEAPYSICFMKAEYKSEPLLRIVIDHSDAFVKV